MILQASVIGALVIAAAYFAAGVLRAKRLTASFANLGREELHVWLRRLAETHEPGACLIFEDMDGSKRFVQFRRESPTAGTLIFDFPVAPWSKPYVTTLLKLLTDGGFTHVEVPGRPGDPVEQFLTVENLTPSSAVDLTDSIFRTVFGHRDTNVRVYGNRVIARDGEGRITRWPKT